jgi:MraZ protein
MLLTGEYEVTLDEAGRIAIPRYLRNILDKDQVVLTRGADSCLWLYTVEYWMNRVETLIGSADPDTELGREVRRRYGPAHPLDLDKQGRVLIAPSLREFAGLSKDCIVLGQFDYIEVWDKERYRAHECSQEKYLEVSEAFARVKGDGNSSRAGAAGGDIAVSRAEGQA